MKVGTVALIGRPNVGKSTLVNALVGHKVSIVSNKPQTTRRRVLGIEHGDGYQIVYVDTPGIHDPHTRLGRAMVEQARSALADVEVLLIVADASHHPGDTERDIAGLVAGLSIPKILALNKMDLLKAENVVRNVEAYTELFGTERYMLTVATRGDNLDELRKMILEELPEGEPLFPDDEYTDQPARFMAAELVREKILQRTRQEVPHATAVRIEGWDQESEPGRVHIVATILVERDSQRGILIGKGGQFVKTIGTDARREIEDLLAMDVYLELHVKVEEGWRQSTRTLQELEYDV